MGFQAWQSTGTYRSAVFLLFPALALSLLLSAPCLAGDPDFSVDSDRAAPDSLISTGVSSKPLRPWQLVLGIGRRNDNGRWDNLVEGLEAGGFDDQYCTGWLGPCLYPEGGALHQVVHLAVVRDLGSRFGVRAFWSNGDFLEGTGYSDDSTVQVNYLNVKSGLRTLGLLAEYIPTRAIRLGLGPSWNTLETTASTQDYAGNDVENFSSSAGCAGLVLGAAANLPPDHPLFLHFAVQYHLMPDQEIGPFGTMPATGIKMSHTALVLAMGLSI